MTDLLPFIKQMDTEAAQQRQADQLQAHVESMRCCWPEWEGPRVEDSVHGHCQVHSLTAHSLKYGDRRYHYMAHCRIESISKDGQTIIAIVGYPEDRPDLAHLNGDRLQLDLSEVWPPVHLLRALRA